MKAILHVNHAAHQREHVAWMREGMHRHGITTETAPRDEPQSADVVVVWAWRQNRVIRHCRQKGIPLLVMERGHLQDRYHFASLGWGGIGNRGRYPAPDDGGKRWRQHWGHLMQPWKGGDYALILGQCEGDASLYNLDFRAWAQDITNALAQRHRVIYRAHPIMRRQNQQWAPVGAEFSTQSLEDDLAGARFAVAYTSTAAVEAVLAGVPAVTLHDGAMARPVSAHGLNDPLWCGDREPWAHRLAWCQWEPKEIRSGEAWAVVREAMPEMAA